MTEVYKQIPAFIEELPIPSLISKDKISPELADLMRESFEFIHKFYLDFDSKRDAKTALINLLQLSFNNLHDLGVSASTKDIIPLTNTYVRETICERQEIQGIIPQDMKMVCNDIIFSN
jgi:hypothetical protein